MKLISMTDFVLDRYETTSNPTFFKETVHDYANFLKQPLTLGMFVPCFSDGSFFSEPEMRQVMVCFDTQDLQYDKQEVADYKIALLKVMFSDFTIIEIVENEYIHISNGTLSLFFHNSNEIESNTNNYNGWVSIVEDFINSNYHLDLALSF